MKNTLTIASKEIKSYFISPIAYVVTTVFLILVGYMFYSRLTGFSIHCFKMMGMKDAAEGLNVNASVFQSHFKNMSTMIMFIMPILTMRVFAEERKNRTMELLMTSPIAVSEIVLGKFFASFSLFVIMCALTLYMPLFTATYTPNLDWGPILTSYLGVLLLGSVFISIGIFASSLTENQIVAALISFAIIIIFLVVEILAGMSEGQAAAILRDMSLVTHLANFFKGVITTKDIVYFLSFSAFALFMTFRVIESKRWKQ